jgi:hypothetical protein
MAQSLKTAGDDLDFAVERLKHHRIKERERIERDQQTDFDRWRQTGIAED